MSSKAQLQTYVKELRSSVSSLNNKLESKDKYINKLEKMYQDLAGNNHQLTEDYISIDKRSNRNVIIAFASVVVAGLLIATFLL